jgi:hypothetical protein
MFVFCKVVKNSKGTARKLRMKEGLMKVGATVSEKYARELESGNPGGRFFPLIPGGAMYSLAIQGDASRTSILLRNSSPEIS